MSVSNFYLCAYVIFVQILIFYCMRDVLVTFPFPLFLAKRYIVFIYFLISHVVVSPKLTHWISNVINSSLLNVRSMIIITYSIVLPVCELYLLIVTTFALQHIFRIIWWKYVSALMLTTLRNLFQICHLYYDNIIYIISHYIYIDNRNPIFILRTIFAILRWYKVVQCIYYLISRQHC